MKKILFVFFLTIVSLGLFTFLASNTTFAKGTHQKTTGEFVGYSGTTRVEMIVSAHNTDSIKGNVSYWNSTGKHFTGEVDICYAQNGDKSVFVGTVTDSNTSGNYFKVWTYDVGEGEMASPDAFRVVLYPSAPDCTDISTGYGAVVSEGNIQVHSN